MALLLQALQRLSKLGMEDIRLLLLFRPQSRMAKAGQAEKQGAVNLRTLTRPIIALMENYLQVVNTL